MYSDNYLDTFYKGSKSASFGIDGKAVGSDNFLEELLALTKAVKNKSGRLLLFGNGASASFANHMALDWSKNGGILALSLSDSALLTALSNDFSYEDAFVEFCKMQSINQNDIIITISSSGNSPNIVSVLNFARKENITTVALSGLKEDNLSRSLANLSVYFNYKTYGMVECAHQLYLHLWLDSYMNIKDWEKTETQNMSSKDFRL